MNEYKPPNPADDNPSTTVHKLVQELNQAISNEICLNETDQVNPNTNEQWGTNAIYEEASDGVIKEQAWLMKEF